MKFQMLILSRGCKFFVILLSFLIFPVDIFAIVDPTSEFYVNDYANILSHETEQYIISKSKELNNVDGTQIVVVTVKNLEGYSIESYANNLFNKFGIGDKDKNNGLLLLLAYKEREFRVEVGYGLEGILPDGKTGRFQDEYIIPYLRLNEWDDGIRNGYDAFFNEIVKKNNLDLTINEVNSSYENSRGNGGVLLVFMIVTIISLFVSIICGLIGRNFYNKKKFIKKYLVVWGFFFLLLFYSLVFIFTLFANLMLFLAVLYDNPDNMSDNYRGIRYIRRGISGSSSSSSWSSSSGSSSGYSSGGSSRGGGGRSGGGGSTRRF